MEALHADERSMIAEKEMDRWAVFDPSVGATAPREGKVWGTVLIAVVAHPSDPFRLKDRFVGDWGADGTRPMRCWLPGHQNGDTHPSGYLVTRDAAGYRCSGCGANMTVLELGVERGLGETAGDVAERLKKLGIKLASDAPSTVIDLSLRALIANRTDQGNAEFFAARFRKNLLYHVEHKTWRVYTGTHWAIDNTGEVMRCAMAATDYMMQSLHQLQHDEQKFLARHAIKTRNESRLRGMVALAKNFMSATSDKFDADPMTINLQNGTIDLRTGEVRSHRAEDYLTKITPVTYDSSAKAPTWEAFVSRALGNDEEYMRYLQRLVGYWLTGKMNEKAFFVIWGPSDTGKTIFAETVKGLLGDYAQTAALSAFTVKFEENLNSPDIARMEGKRLVLAAESGEGKRLNEEVIKRITGGDSITACYKYGNHFEFSPQCKVVLVTNFRPEIREADDSIWNRVKVLPFTVVIPGDEKDTELLSKLCSERPGILNWALDGVRVWLRNGLGSCSAVASITREYRSEMDVLGQFISECCVAGRGRTVSAKALYSAYADWTKANGYAAITQNMFSRRLKDKGFEKPDARGKWQGIALQESCLRDATSRF